MSIVRIVEDLEAQLREAQTTIAQLQALLQETVEVAKKDNANLQVMIEQVRLHKDEIAQLTEQLDGYQNREASCCPEDVGFEEVIGLLRKQLAQLTEERDAERHKVQITEQAARDVIEILRKQLAEAHAAHQGLVEKWRLQIRMNLGNQTLVECADELELLNSSPLTRQGKESA